MSNVKLKEKRQRSWLRGERRHKVNRERNEARRTANLEALKTLSGTIQMKTYVNRHGKEVTKRESPSEALARTRREAAGWVRPA